MARRSRGRQRGRRRAARLNWTPRLLPNTVLRKALTSQQARRYRATVRLLHKWVRHLDRRPTLSHRQAIHGFAQQCREWAEKYGLTIALSTLRAYRSRVDPASPLFDFNTDSRGRR